MMGVIIQLFKEQEVVQEAVQVARERTTREEVSDMDRSQVIKEIKRALKERTGITYSVTGGKGSAYGWLKISAIPSRQVNGYMSDEDRETLRVALGLDRVHFQGQSIPASNNHYAEYIDRARGNEPQVIGKQYWD